MMKSLELVKTGIGMPSFISDECYIGNLVKKGVPLEVAGTTISSAALMSLFQKAGEWYSL